MIYTNKKKNRKRSELKSITVSKMFAKGDIARKK
jgi:hypothetical protein